MNTYLTEFLGTLVFLTIVLRSGNDKFIIAFGLLAALCFMGLGHFNPAITFMDCMQGGCNTGVALGMIASQIAGAYAALQLVKYT